PPQQSERRISTAPAAPTLCCVTGLKNSCVPTSAPQTFSKARPPISPRPLLGTEEAGSPLPPGGRGGGGGGGEHGGAVATIDDPITERPGTVIGPYKLLEQIGEGGFGVVFMAEQQEPIRRKVALKVIKPGMDTRQVIARFEAERQALALMDHPNIAKVLDAGTTGTVASGQ